MAPGDRAMRSVGLQGVIGGYALTLGAGLVLGGRLGDRYGRRRMFLVGLAAFAVTSLLCAVAPNIESLIVLRLLQGTAGAMLLPQGLGLLRENFSGPELTKAFAISGPVLGLGGIIGPVLGGFLIEGDFSRLGWRSVFLINLPIGVAALSVAAMFVARKPGDRTVRVDMTGAALVVISCALLVLPLNQGQENGWPLWTWLSMAASVIGFALFALQQRRTAAAGREPLVTQGLLRKPAFTVGLGGGGGRRRRHGDRRPLQLHPGRGRRRRDRIRLRCPVGGPGRGRFHRRRGLRLGLLRPGQDR